MKNYDEYVLNQDFKSWENVETYLGIDIYQHSATKRISVDLWCEKTQKPIEITHHDLDGLKDRLNEILAQNYYLALECIFNHFKGAVKDYSTADQNCENLLEQIAKRIKEKTDQAIFET